MGEWLIADVSLWEYPNLDALCVCNLPVWFRLRLEATAIVSGLSVQ
jgi:hypothetical protein